MPIEETTPTARSEVTLSEITAETVRAVCRLAVRDEQQGFVAPNAVSIAQAHFSEHAWFRAIMAGDTPVGFVMLHDEPEKPVYFLWRFMIDARYQGLGFGRRGLERLVQHVRTRPGAVELLTSVVQAPGGPQGFYESLGFELTGDYEEGEAVLRLDLSGDTRPGRPSTAPRHERGACDGQSARGRGGRQGGQPRGEDP
jgi:diamine N-acetyltransferase